MQEIVPYFNLIPMAVLVFVLSWTKSIERDLRSRTKKDYADETFQRKDLCEQISSELKSNVKEIMVDVKELLRRNGG